jgi:murein DD-endopeptidase MepM/ murein hydrolase activator NlpD
VPQPSEFEPYAEGEMLSRRLMEGDVATLERAMTPRFLAAIGGREGLARMVRDLRGQAGREAQVLRQAAYSEAGHITYYRVSRFERMPSVTTRWVFNSDRRVAALSVSPTPVPAATRHSSDRTRGAFRLPFGVPSGGNWYVAWGGNDHISNKHVVAPDQRFAYDFVVTRGRDVFGGDGTRNEDHFCWNEPIYAPAAGRVVRAVGDVADNAPGTPPTAPPAGNHVVIDHGGGVFSLLAHFRLGSVAVRQGQQVSSGTLIGRCGNSGRSELPHLHYHLQNAAAYGEGEGLPASFRGYFLGGAYVPEGRPVRGDYVVPAQGRPQQ